MPTDDPLRAAIREALENSVWSPEIETDKVEAAIAAAVQPLLDVERAQLAGAEEQNRSLQELLDEAAEREQCDRLRESLMAVMDVVHQQGAGLWPCCGSFYKHAPACPMSIAQGLLEMIPNV